MNTDFDNFLNVPIERVITPPELFDSIMNRVQASRRVPKRFIWATAASIALLIAINYGAVRQSESSKSSLGAFQKEYFPNTSVNVF